MLVLVVWRGRKGQKAVPGHGHTRNSTAKKKYTTDPLTDDLSVSSNKEFNSKSRDRGTLGSTRVGGQVELRVCMCVCVCVRERERAEKEEL